MGRAAVGVAVAQHVAAPVDPRPLAVPHRKDALVTGLGEEVELLAAHDRGHRQVFVETGLEMDVIVLEELARPPQV